MIPISVQKMVFTILLIAGIAGLVFFTIVVAAEGPPRRQPAIIYSWVASCVAAVILSVFMLRRLTRIEPSSRAGRWQLTFVDLYVATFFSAGCILLWKRYNPDTLLYWGATASVCAGIGLVLALLTAASRGYTRFRARVPLAVGILLASVGKCFLGLLLAFSVLFLLVAGPKNFAEVWAEILFISPNTFNPDSILTWIRGGLLMLPAGWLICKVTESICKRDVTTKAHQTENPQDSAP